MRSILFIALSCPIAHADSLAENQARFGRITGTVQVLSPGSSQWIDAHTDMPFEPGDEIRVDEESEAELSIAKNVFWILLDNTDLIVGHTTTLEGRLTMTRGSLLGKVENAGGLTGTWEFETPMGVCGVRGTEFILTHTDEEGTHLGVIKGTVDMRPADTATESFPAVMINAHEEGVLKKKKPLKKLTAFSPVIQVRTRQLSRLQKRFQDTSNVWSPLTNSYRIELRRKFVAPVAHHKAPPRHSIPTRKGQR